MTSEWSFTVGQVLKRPLFQNAEIVAGKRGLVRTFRWVHVLESAENASFLNGEELILSTGIGFGENDEKRLTYLKELVRRNASGLCIELGAHIPEIPANMIELADHYEFPLIIFTRPVRFVDITQDLHQHIVNRQSEALRRLEAYSRELQQLTLQTSSLSRVLTHFQSMTNTQTLFISLDGPTLFYPGMPHSVQRELTSLLEAKLISADNLPVTNGLLPLSDKKQILYQPIMAMGNVLAYLGAVLYDRVPDEFLYLTFDYTATALAQMLLRRMFAQERSLDNENRLLEDILQDRIHSEEHFRTALGIPPHSSPIPAYRAAILQIDIDGQKPLNESSFSFHDLLGVFRFIFTRHGFRPLLLSKGPRLYVLLIENHLGNRRELLEQALKEIQRTCDQTFGPETNIQLGVSTVFDHYAQAGYAFQEAEQALEFSKESAICFFNDLGVSRLLLQVRNQNVLSAFIEDYLGPLLQYEKNQGGELLQTLRVFLEQSLSKQAAAQVLYIHRQTLYHRLKKIEELLGENCFLPENRFCLELAIRAYDWLHSQ
ncbi:MAG: PucR family transcriptional regulator [Peptococcaceae bacterium]|nr:PucR family transcriptional regulator [Peptococcaceae bacterium]